MGDPSETLTRKLRRSQRILEREIDERNISFDTRDALDRLTELEKHKDDQPDDSLVKRGEA